MGCDIHAYIEYKWDEDHGYPSHWHSFGGELNLPRSYRTFALMAGVRGDADPVVAPRGIPAEMGWSAESDYWTYVGPHSKDFEARKARAEDWVKAGLSVWKDESKEFVSGPDWHTHSWLTPDEYAKVVSQLEGDSPEYRAVLAALLSFELSGCQARLVFWFDN